MPNILIIFFLLFRTLILNFHALAWWKTVEMGKVIVQTWHSLHPSIWGQVLPWTKYNFHHKTLLFVLSVLVIRLICSAYEFSDTIIIFSHNNCFHSSYLLISVIGRTGLLISLFYGAYYSNSLLPTTQGFLWICHNYKCMMAMCLPSFSVFMQVELLQRVWLIALGPFCLTFSVENIFLQAM